MPKWPGVFNVVVGPVGVVSGPGGDVLGPGGDVLGPGGNHGAEGVGWRDPADSLRGDREDDLPG